jgi:TPR repeat protein
MKERITTLLAGSVIALAAFGVAVAASIEDGRTAYSNGDYAVAMQVLRPFADQGYADVQAKLGYMYYFGQGVPQDYTQALVWFRRAADQGEGSAQGMLGVMYDQGQGVPQDEFQASVWYRKYADRGVPPSQLNIGVQYARGVGVLQDYVLAHMWFNLASSGGDAQIREQAVKNRDLVSAHMTPDQIAEAQKMAREWKPSSR